MTTTKYEERQQQKRFNVLAREVATKKVGQKVAFNALVQRVEGGAFVETQVWVSDNDIENAAMEQTAILDKPLTKKDLDALSNSIIDSLPEQ